MAQPFIKFPGGKRDHVVIDTIIKLQPSLFDTFVEPFVGGGGILFGLEASNFFDGVTVIAGDADADLVGLYAAIRRNPHSVYRKARAEADHVGSYKSEKQRKKAYNDLRDLWNLGDKKPGYQLYLRHACFNGVFRVNKKGEMNMPPRDRLENVYIPQVPELLSCAQALQGVELLDWDFRTYEERLFIGPGTLVYLDPPYDGDKAFREYTAAGFTDDDQRELIELAATWADRGATVVYSNADTPLVRKLLTEYWPESTVAAVSAKRTVSCDGETRNPAAEVIAYGGHD